MSSATQPSPAEPVAGPPRRLRVWIAATLVLIGCAVGLVAWAGQSAAVLARLGEAVTASVSEGMAGGRMRLGGVSGSLFGPLELQAIALEDAKGRALVKVGKVTVDYRLLPFLSRRLVLSRVAVDGLEVNGVIEPDGGLNLARLFAPSPPSEGPLPVALAVEALSFEGGKLTVRDARNEMARVVALRQFELEGSVTVSRERVAAFELKRMGLRWRVGGIDAELPLELRQMSLLQDAMGLRVVVSRLAIRNTELFGFRAQVTPSTSGKSPFGTLELALPRGSISPELARALVPGLELRAPLQLSARMGGPAERLGVHVEAKAAGNPVLFDGALDLRDPALPGYVGALLVQNFRPQEWLVLEGPGSNVSARLSVAGRGFAASNMKARIELDVGPSMIAGFPLERAYGNLTVDAGRVTLTDLSAAALGGELDGSGSASLSGAVALRLRAGLPDASAATPWLPPSLGRPSGSAELLLDVEALLPEAERRDLGSKSPQQIWQALGPELAIALSLRGDELRAAPGRVGKLLLEVEKRRGAEAPLTAHLDLREMAAGGLTDARLQMDAEVVRRELQLTVQAAAPRRFAVRLEAGAALSEEAVAVTLRRLVADAAGLEVGLDGAGAARIELQDGRRPVAATLDPVTLRFGVGSVRVSGSWEESGALQGRLSASKLDLRALALSAASAEAVGDFAGLLDLDVGIAGTASAPRGELSLSLSELGARGLGPYRADLSASYAPGKLKGSVRLTDRDGERFVSDLQLPVTLPTAGGAILWSARQPLEVHWKLAPTPIAPLVAAAALPVSKVTGAVRGEGTVRGLMSALDVSGAVTADGLGATVSRDGLGVRLEELGLTTGLAYVSAGPSGPSLQARAELDWSGTKTATVAAELGLDVAALLRDPEAATERLRHARSQLLLKLEETDLAKLPGPLKALAGVTGGRVGGTLRWDNQGDLPVIEVDGQAAGLTIQGLDAVDASLTASTRDETTVRATLDYGGAPVLAFSGTIAAPLDTLLEPAVRATRRLEARAEIAPVALARLGVVLPQLRKVGGTASGYLDVTGNLVAPSLRGRAVLRGLSAEGSRRADAGVEFLATPARISVSGTVCGEQTEVEAAASEPLTFRAQWSVPPGAWMNLLAKGERPQPQSWPLSVALRAQELPLASVASNALLGAAASDVVGLLTADLSVTGSIAEPVVVGAARVSDLGATLAALHRRVENADAEVVFAPGRVELRQLEVAEAGSSLRASGQVLLSGTTPASARASLALKNFLVTDPKGTSIFVTGKVESAASRGPSGWTASTVIRESRIAVPEYANAAQYGPTQSGEGVYFVGEDVAAAQVGKQKPSLLSEATTGARAAAAVPIRLHVETTGENRVEHTYADIDYQIGLDVTVNGDSIVPVGTVTLPKGTLRFAGKSFDIRRGLISFDGVGENPMDAVLDIQAVHTLSAQVAANLPPATGGAAIVTLGVTGTVSAPVVRFESDPPMPQEDVLFVLLTGRPIAREEAANGEAVAAQQQALATAGSLVLGLVSDRLPGVGVDSLSIESDAQTGRAVSRVEGGKYIAEDLFVSGIYIPQAAEDENDFEVALDWIVVRVGPDSLRFTLRGGNRGNGGLEMLYNMMLR